MLYHQRQIDYRDDPYFLADIRHYETALGVAPGYFRGAASHRNANVRFRGGAHFRCLPKED
jgi:hypothetical protein